MRRGTQILNRHESDRQPSVVESSKTQALYLSIRISTARTKSASVPRSLGLESPGTFALLPPPFSPGSQIHAAKLPHSHQPPPALTCPANTGATKRNVMNTDAIKRFLTILSSTAKLERGQLYQLIQSAETSYLWRDIQSQRDIGLVLQSFAYPFNQVGKYYESVYLFRTGQHQKARDLLERS